MGCTLVEQDHGKRYGWYYPFCTLGLPFSFSKVAPLVLAFSRWSSPVGYLPYTVSFLPDPGREEDDIVKIWF